MTTQLSFDASHNIHQIFDKVFKRIFALSNGAIINLINGLFNKDYPTDAELVLTRNEFVTTAFESRLADVFVQINGRHRYHLEAEIQGEEDIVLRVFEYGFLDALQNREPGSMTLRFAEPMVIYLNNSAKIPATSTLRLRFGSQEPILYTVENFVLLRHKVEEINRKKMILLIPFYALKFRDELKKVGKIDYDALHALLHDDIIGSIEANLKFGNISEADYEELIRLTGALSEYLYSDYFKKEGTHMGRLFPDALILPGDDLRYEIQTLQDTILEKDVKINALSDDMAALTADMNALTADNAALTAELTALRAQLAQLTAN